MEKGRGECGGGVGKCVGIGGGTGGPWPPPLFFRGSPGGPNLRVYFYNIASA